MEELADARAQVAERRGRVEHLERAIADTFIIAPFNGVVAECYVEPGGLAGPSRPIARLLSNDIPRLRFAMPEAQARRVVVGTHIQVRLTSSDEALGGVVESVVPEVDAAARMIFAVARVDVPAILKSLVSAGMLARVRIADQIAEGPGGP